jgi:Tol biopolymer transport system component
VFVFAGRLVAQDTNGQPDVYVRDRETDSVELISRAVDGGPADMGSKQEVDISDDGRFVVFASRATNIVVGDNNGRRDVFLYDRLRATTRLVSHAKGRSANGTSYEPVISGDGRTVAFTSGAANLVAGDTNRRRDIFVWNRADSSISRVSVDSAGRQIYKWPTRRVHSRSAHRDDQAYLGQLGRATGRRRAKLGCRHLRKRALRRLRFTRLESPPR